MNLTNAVNEVLLITKRPDKRVETIAQINRALSFFTLKADFSKDLVESSLTLDPTLYGQSISLSALTRFRKFKYIKPTNERYYLTEADPTNIFTPTGQIQPNRFFVSASSLTITLSKLSPSLQIGYYTYAPVLTEVTNFDTHWMLDMIPYAVIEKATAKIFQIVGDETSARFYEGSAMELFLTARRDFETQVTHSI